MAWLERIRLTARGARPAAVPTFLSRSLSLSLSDSLSLVLFLALSASLPNLLSRSSIITCAWFPAYRLHEVLLVKVAGAPEDRADLPLRQDVDVSPQGPRTVPITN